VHDVLIKAGAELECDNVYGLELKNGSRVLALPGSDDSIRGLTVDGWIVAGWRLDASGSGFELTVIPFVALSGRVEAGIDREVVSISQFLERPVRWTSEALVG